MLTSKWNFNEMFSRLESPSSILSLYRCGIGERTVFERFYRNHNVQLNYGRRRYAEPVVDRYRVYLWTVGMFDDSRFCCFSRAARCSKVDGGNERRIDAIKLN